MEIKGKYKERHRFAFKVEDYNPQYALMIDPVLVYSTYVGGDNWGDGYDIAVDSSGSVYVIGYTHSTDFPTKNPFQGMHGDGTNAFVTKLGDLQQQEYDLAVSKSGTSVTLTATPSSGSAFGGWSVDCSACGNNTTCNITMDTNKSCIAELRRKI